ncbi:MAG: aminotransferase class I/II-fold pyridoxal phosphate-dependent enzyme, partial [Candidatus Korarchaeum sp.]|nr:aminotransferase class I/II-fold pyridoxal phosphate-dependent enzyme [Candidatus Korarchaeum sp.]MDW8035345.1 aminotransferase class I/II-fold pyridoxal phosphate-dependent enzyme [Candidatus Korarchaeum sp.]
HNMNIDIDKSLKRMEESKPKLVILGGSVILFPHPVREISDACRSIGALLHYDAAHVAGLIAGKQFQQPMEEGADVMTMSTHKTLFGPQHGVVVTNDEEKFEKIKLANFPGLLSNHHLHSVAALALAAAEMLAFGEDYAKQVIKNAKSLARAMHDEGFNVVAEHLGFTESHQVLLDVDALGGGYKCEKLLEEANIIVNRNLLPWDIKRGRSFKDPGGLRLGVAELTRLGMSEDEMVEIAKLYRKVLLDKEDPRKVAEKVAALRRRFRTVKYAFEEGPAYEY